jgi:hypothetical protein
LGTDRDLNEKTAAGNEGKHSSNTPVYGRFEWRGG